LRRAAHSVASGCFRGARAARRGAEHIEDTISPTRQCPFKVRTTFDCLIVFMSPLFSRRAGYAASGADRVGGGGRPSSLEAASSQTWASCRKDTRTSSACASRAHLKDSSAIARYSAAVFMKRCAFPQQDLLQVVASLSALGPTQQRNYEQPYFFDRPRRRNAVIGARIAI